MSERNDTQHTSISKARTVEEIADFWDTHSLADYWDQTHEVEFEVRTKRRRRVTLFVQMPPLGYNQGELPHMAAPTCILTCWS